MQAHLIVCLLVMPLLVFSLPSSSIVRSSSKKQDMSGTATLNVSQQVQRYTIAFHHFRFGNELLPPYRVRGHAV